MTAHAMRVPCAACGERVGILTPTNGQNVVRCRRCGRACYNAPKSEMGESVRSIVSRPGIDPAQRARVLHRDGGRCIFCGRGSPDGVILHVGHVLSVAEGRALGVTAAEIFDDFNLAAMCEEDNLGLGAHSLDPLMWLRLVRARINGRGLVDSTALCGCGHSYAAHREAGKCVRCDCSTWVAA